MNENAKNALTGDASMVLVYDIRRDERLKADLFGRAPEQLNHYFENKVATSVFEGRITELCYAAYDAQHCFKVHDGEATHCYERLGDDSWYVVGRHVQVEQADFEMPYPTGRMPIVTRIWIGSEKPQNK